ncbi:anaphase-promoting complex subunit 6 isoform X2 [Zea mays]|uniref:Anaphase-promoting complex subunit 6 n=2 Tax=Zea mays TaxID=4577 RepID=A0A804RA38_MAIZE|nr:anaphase-promoting complex subunit 6 isoform X2 [Zea mays]|eukprot:XP_008660356.1 anaphase-promoting complex subunit 6 isoform X3 [Zea mays]
MRNSNFGFPRVLPTSSASAEPSPKRRRIGEATDPPPEMREEALERLRGVVRDSAGKHLYTSAIFLADKVAAATGDPGDVYMLAQALFLGRQFRRALHLLNNSRLLRDLRFRFLAAKCLEELKEWHQCLLMLGDAKVDEHGNVLDHDVGSDIYFDKDAEDHEINIKSALCFLRGKAYEALDNRDLARQWYKAAVKADPLCYEAIECLVDNYMLTCEEEVELLSSLQFGEEDGWLSAFYSCLVTKHEKEYLVEAKFKELEQEACSISSSSSGETMKNNIDVLVCKAEYYHQSGEYQKCFKLTSSLLERDPFHLKCTLVHLATAMELGHCNDLYLLACNLVKDYPQKALSWFAVGCYYYCIKKYDQARRYFGKATGLDGAFPPAWIGTGIAYAAQEEGDQAMAAFRTAARLFPGCHLPTLYMGMQYVRMHNFKLAEQFFTQAKSICPSDPLIHNELGVVAYNMKEEYQKAVSYYAKALTFPTKSLSAFAGLAYTYHLMDDFEAAINYYHKALWLKPDDQFCTDMLTYALESICQITARRKPGRGLLTATGGVTC